MKADRDKLKDWFKANQRILPWRKEPRDPYGVWVSEIMLQQTQVQTVIPYYERWLQQFPDIASLAAADLAAIKALWAGLGYYSRAENLYKGALWLKEYHQSKIPPSYQEILKIPGVGKYTAGAIGSFGYSLNVPILDGNLIRLFSRYYYDDQPWWNAEGQTRFWNYSIEWIRKGDAKEINEALMELGALVCRPKNPQCEACPLGINCKSKKTNEVLNLPLKRPKKMTKELEVSTLVICSGSEYYLLKGWSGLLKKEWCFFSETEKWVNEWKEKNKKNIRSFWSSGAFRIVHHITHHKIGTNIFFADVEKAKCILPDDQGVWVSENEIEGLLTSSLMQKVYQRCKQIRLK